MHIQVPEKNPSAYDALFSGTYSSILSRIELFHSPTFIHILHKVRKSRSHFYEAMQRIFQATASYARFIGLIHPIMAHQKGDVIADIRTEREKTIVGKAHKIKDFIVQNELIDLTNGVIPYFYRTNKNDHLYHISGAYLSHFFKRAS